MLGGLQRFLADKDASTIELRFIGTGVIEEVSNIIKRELPADITVISKRVPQIDAVKAMLDSDVLFYPGWKGYRGMVSGKIFEYLAAKRNILIAPSDEDVIERLLKETGAGKTANSINEFVRVLDRWYNEWKRIGVLQYNGLDQNIRRYSRERQAACLASEIIDINGSLPA